MIDCINTNIYLNINNVISIISFRIFSKKGIHQSISHFESRRISPNHYSTHITPITGPIASIASSPRFHDEVTTTPSRYSPTHFPRSLSRQIHNTGRKPPRYLKLIRQTIVTETDAAYRPIPRGSYGDSGIHHGVAGFAEGIVRGREVRGPVITWPAHGYRKWYRCSLIECNLFC